MKRTLLAMENSGWLSTSSFWQSLTHQKVTLVENDKIITQDIKLAAELNTFFSNVVKKLKIHEFRERNSFTKRITNPTLKSILKYRKHPSDIAIKDLNIRSHFLFSLVSVDEALKEVKKLNLWKAAQSSYVHVRVLKGNTELIWDFICVFFNESRNSKKFHLFWRRTYSIYRSKSLKGAVVWF